MSPLYRDIFDLSWYFLSNLWLYRCVFDTGPEADANINKNNNNNNEPWQRYPLPECHFTLCMFAQQAKTVSVTRQHAGLGSTNGWLKPGWLSSSSGEKNTNRLEEHICEFSQHRRVCGCLYGKINTEILVRRLTEVTLFKTCGWKKIKEAKEGRRKGYGIDMRILLLYTYGTKWLASQHATWVVFEVEVYVPAGWHDRLSEDPSGTSCFHLKLSYVTWATHYCIYGCDVVTCFGCGAGFMVVAELCSGQAFARGCEGLMYGVHKVHKITEVEQKRTTSLIYGWQEGMRELQSVTLR